MTASLPLLLFPVSKPAKRGPGSSGGSDNLIPTSSDKRNQRLQGFKDVLSSAILSLSEKPGDPTRILVLETIGSNEEFSQAVSKIEGLDWQLEEERDDLSSEEIEDIYSFDDINSTIDNDKISVPKAKKIYLSATNKEALGIIEQMYTEFLADPSARASNNTAAFRNIFKYIIDLRFWNETDRLESTGIIDYWREEITLKKGFSSSCIFDIELAYLDSDYHAQLLFDRVKAKLLDEGVTILAVYRSNEIRYHALKVELPMNMVEQALEAFEGKINFHGWLQIDEIKFCLPIAQHTMFDDETEVSESLNEKDFQDLPAGFTLKDPVIALLDGMPLQNHLSLNNRIVLDDPDRYSENYPVKSRLHGTSMASLICHDDLNNPSRKQLPRAIYVRPIFNTTSSDINEREQIPKTIFLEDLLERAVMRISTNFPSIRIINLSIGIPHQPFFKQVSPLAKLIDYLAWKHNLLFVISAGNTDILPLEIKADQNINEDYLNSLIENENKRKLISPAESINGLTVGSVNNDYSETSSSSLNNLLDDDFPSPFSRIGSGFRGQIKPDLVTQGGRQGYISRDGFYEGVEPPRTSISFGQRSATVGVSSENIKAHSLSRGTSNSAAVVSHNLGHLYEEIFPLFEQYTVSDKYLAITLKNLAIHSSNWGKEEQYKEIFSPIIKDKKLQHRSAIKESVAKYYGFGIARFDRVIACTDSRVTLLGVGSLELDQKQIFSLNIPEIIQKNSKKFKTNKVDIYLTVSWLAPISPDYLRYRSTKMSVKLIPAQKESKKKQPATDQTKKGNVYHQYYRKIMLSDKLDIEITCLKDAVENHASQNLYSLALTIEPHNEVEIYEEIKNSISVGTKVTI